MINVTCLDFIDVILHIIDAHYVDFCLRCVQEDYNHYLYESQHPSNIGKIDVSEIDKNIAP